MLAPTKFCVCLSKIKTKNFSGDPKFPLILKVGPLPYIKKLFL